MFFETHVFFTAGKSTRRLWQLSVQKRLPSVSGRLNRHRYLRRQFWLPGKPETVSLYYPAREAKRDQKMPFLNRKAKMRFQQPIVQLKSQLRP